MPGAGLEPARWENHPRILSPLCLPFRHLWLAKTQKLPESLEFSDRPPLNGVAYLSSSDPSSHTRDRYSSLTLTFIRMIRLLMNICTLQIFIIDTSIEELREN